MQVFSYQTIFDDSSRVSITIELAERLTQATNLLDTKNSTNVTRQKLAKYPTRVMNYHHLCCMENGNTHLNSKRFVRDSTK